MPHRLFSPFLICALFFLSTLSAEENFLLLDGTTNETLLEQGPSIDQRFSPCCTFNIPLSLMGYDTGVLQDAHAPIWHFQEDYHAGLDSWKTSQSPLSWMQLSCVWYSKLLGLALGLDTIQNHITLFAYGNQDMTGGLASPTEPHLPGWVNSSLQISPREQVDFIHRMLHHTLPLSHHTITETKTLLFKEELPNGWKLFGKTGWSGSDITKDGTTLEHAWFVGWIEKDHLFFPFAYLKRGTKIPLDQISRVKQLVTHSEILNTFQN